GVQNHELLLGGFSFAGVFYISQTLAIRRPGKAGVQLAAQGRHCEKALYCKFTGISSSGWLLRTHARRGGNTNDNEESDEQYWTGRKSGIHTGSLRVGNSCFRRMKISFVLLIWLCRPASRSEPLFVTVERLARRPAEIPAAQQMQVQVKDRLARAAA